MISTQGCCRTRSDKDPRGGEVGDATKRKSHPLASTKKRSAPGHKSSHHMIHGNQPRACRTRIPKISRSTLPPSDILPVRKRDISTVQTSTRRSSTDSLIIKTAQNKQTLLALDDESVEQTVLPTGSSGNSSVGSKTVAKSDSDKTRVRRKTLHPRGSTHTPPRHAARVAGPRFRLRPLGPPRGGCFSTDARGRSAGRRRPDSRARGAAHAFERARGHAHVHLSLIHI